MSREHTSCLNLVTFSDSAYFTYLNCLVTSVKRNLVNRKLFVYDWGLDRTQVEWLKIFDFCTVVPWEPTTAQYQKTLVAQHAYRNFFEQGQEPFVMIDADSFVLGDFRREVFQHDFNLGVTFRGGASPVNAGVIFFKPTNSAFTNLLQDWQARARWIADERGRDWYCDQDALIAICKEAGLEKQADDVTTKVVTNRGKYLVKGSSFGILGFSCWFYNNWMFIEWRKQNKLPYYYYTDIIGPSGEAINQGIVYYNQLTFGDIKIIHFKNDDMEVIREFPFNILREGYPGVESENRILLWGRQAARKLLPEPIRRSLRRVKSKLKPSSTR